MEKTYSAADSIRNDYPNLSKKEKQLIAVAKKLLESITKKHNITIEDLFKYKKEECIPVSVFTKKLTPLEATVKFLKENRNYSLREISKLISRDERNIWHIYSDSKKKHPNQLEEIETKIFIPVRIISNEKLSALESIVVYLKENFSLNYSKIAALLNRDQRTVWTVYQRAKKNV